MKMNLKILTPERIVLDREVEQVTATAIDGELTILKHHEPLITALAIGILHYTADDTEEAAAVIGGLMEVGENQVVVLSDTAELGREIDEARAKAAKERAEAEQTQKTDKLDLYFTEIALLRAMARLKAVQFSRRHHSTRTHN